MTDRRDFLKAASAAAAVGALSHGATADAWALAKIRQERPGMDDDERRQLIAEAHFGLKPTARSRNGMAICAHPLATREAVNVLKTGGNAVDAALCASVTQTVVEPHMTGITGILSMLCYDAATRETTYLNCSADVTLAAEMGPNGFANGPGVPGFWAGFEAALDRHGTKAKSELVAPAIRYARGGFETHAFLWGEIFAQFHLIARTAAGREIFAVDNALPRPGDMLYQRRAADTLERLVDEGNDYFYRGAFAEEYCRIAAVGGRAITREDFEHYEPRWQEPAWGTYRGHEVAGAPPPDNGGAFLIEILNILELTDLAAQGPPTESPRTLDQMIRAVNLVLRESQDHLDPAAYPVDLERLLSKQYARERFERLASEVPSPGASPALSVPGSNHVSVVDGQGNVATILHTCNSLPWSNGLFVEGVTMCDVGAAGMPGYRKSSYILPNIIFSDGAPILTSGSPSVSLIQNVLQNTVNIVDFDIPLEESVNRPRFGSTSVQATLAGRASNEIMVEADLDESVVHVVEEGGIVFERVNPWNWHLGAFEGIYIEPVSGLRVGRGDPRRTSKAEGVD